MKNGFTLVELSIVLVIIGLLIGGILVGQSLIDSAKLNALVRQTQQYDSAIMAFKDKYKVLPGESGIVIPVRTSGTSTPAEKDGLITDDDQNENTTYFSATNAEEYMMVWKDLATLMNVKIKNCPNLATTTPVALTPQISGANCNMPESEYGDNKNIVIVAASYTTKVFTSDYKLGNAYFFVDCSSQTTSTWSCMGAFTQPEAMAYDAKIDDGKAESGFLTSRIRLNPSSVMRSLVTAPAAYDLTSKATMITIQKFANGL